MTMANVASIQFQFPFSIDNWQHGFGGDCPQLFLAELLGAGAHRSKFWCAPFCVLVRTKTPGGAHQPRGLWQGFCWNGAHLRGVFAM